MGISVYSPSTTLPISQDRHGPSSTPTFPHPSGPFWAVMRKHGSAFSLGDACSC
ncbi:hypothetical protein BDV93DRAFT_517233, partial [Ceratobasidium sp. AG-I]